MSILTALARQNIFVNIVLMSKRTDALTEVAKPVADRLAVRCGSLKKVLSASVLAFDALSAEERERYMAIAEGVDLNSSSQVLEMIENVAEYITYNLLSPDESRAAAKLRRALGPEPPKKK